MKRFVLILSIALMGTMVMNAQPQRHHGTPEQMAEQRVERLDKALSLTEAQKAEITKIYKEEMELMGKDHPQQVAKGEKREKPDEATMKARHEKMEARRAATEAKIEALLTPEQATKFAELKKDGGKRGHARPHDGQRGGAKKASRDEGCNGCNGCKEKK